MANFQANWCEKTVPELARFNTIYVRRQGRGLAHVLVLINGTKEDVETCYLNERNYFMSNDIACALSNDPSAHPEGTGLLFRTKEVPGEVCNVYDISAVHQPALNLDTLVDMIALEGLTVEFIKSLPAICLEYLTHKVDRIGLDKLVNDMLMLHYKKSDEDRLIPEDVLYLFGIPTIPNQDLDRIRADKRQKTLDPETAKILEALVEPKLIEELKAMPEKLEKPKEVKASVTKVTPISTPLTEHIPVPEPTSVKPAEVEKTAEESKDPAVEESPSMEQALESVFEEDTEEEAEKNKEPKSENASKTKEETPVEPESETTDVSEAAVEETKVEDAPVEVAPEEEAAAEETQKEVVTQEESTAEPEAEEESKVDAAEKVEEPKKEAPKTIDSTTDSEAVTEAPKPRSSGRLFSGLRSKSKPAPVAAPAVEESKQEPKVEEPVEAPAEEEEDFVPAPVKSAAKKITFQSKEELTDEDKALNKELLHNIRAQYEETLQFIRDGHSPQFTIFINMIEEVLDTNVYTKQWCPLYLEISDDLSSELYARLYALDKATAEFNKKLIHQVYPIGCPFCANNWEEDITFVSPGLHFVRCPKCGNERGYEKK